MKLSWNPTVAASRGKRTSMTSADTPRSPTVLHRDPPFRTIKIIHSMMAARIAGDLASIRTNTAPTTTNTQNVVGNRPIPILCIICNSINTSRPTCSPLMARICDIPALLNCSETWPHPSPLIPKNRAFASACWGLRIPDSSLPLTVRRNTCKGLVLAGLAFSTTLRVETYRACCGFVFSDSRNQPIQSITSPLCNTQPPSIRTETRSCW